MDSTPGAVAREWVAGLAREHGGYNALAKRAGLSWRWAQRASEGSVPFAATVAQLAWATGTPSSQVDRVVQDANAHRLWAPRRKPRATCAVCKRQASTTVAAKHPSYDPATALFEHPSCTQIMVQCPSCPPGKNTRWIAKGRLKSRAHHESSDGLVFVRCISCTGKSNMARANLAQDEYVLDWRAKAILLHGAKTSGEQKLLELVQSRGLKLDNACALVERSNDPEVRQVCRALRMEQMLRAMGDGDLERGRQARVELVRTVVPRTGRRGGVPGIGRPNAVVVPRLRGIFALCSVCGLLVYKEPGQARGATHAWHGPCWHAWRRSAVVTEWFHDRLIATRHGVSREVLPDFPLPPVRRGAPVTAEDLGAAYRSLLGLRHKRTLTALAAEGGVTKQAVLQRVTTIQNRLPASWDLVFVPRNNRRDLARQQLLSLPIRGPGQEAAAERMASLGISSNVIEQVTGVTVTEAQTAR